jgi:hypothetical protein
MSDWVKWTEKLPKVCEGCLLLIKQHSPEGYFWDDYIVTAFWSDEFGDHGEEGFYITNHTFENVNEEKDGEWMRVGRYEFIGYGNQYVRVDSWMPLPEPPKD